MNDSEFRIVFKKLTENEPLRWQERLFHQHFVRNDIRRVIDLPTGLGKTMVMAIWLIARAVNMALPRRLIYVVDRRTVVDQATDLAKLLLKNVSKALPSLANLAVSTLRGQLADNRDWTRAPSRPAIVIGTVDMIGSRLLFSGYRSSYKQRPLDAGLLGQDSLLVLDEAHLSEPFSKLLDSIERFQGGKGLPMRVMKMSATTSGNDASRFKLEASDLEGDRESNPIVERFTAEKHLRIKYVEKKMQAEIVETAAQLGSDASRVVVFVRSPDEATKIAEALRKHGDNKGKSFGEAVEVLTGTMRGLERDELLEKPVMKRFLDPDNRPNEGPAILVSTSAGEVGFDLNADHLVCDAAPLDPMIQRLGRVNRRGDGAAIVRVFAAKSDEKKSKKDEAKQAKPRHTIESASAAAMVCLSKLTKHEDGTHDASPKALSDLRGRTDLPCKIEEAFTPTPTILTATDILFDAWAMTTIRDKLPGRPEVAPYLHGIADDLPQTSIAWRAELDLIDIKSADAERTLQAIFTKHRIRPHETLAVGMTKTRDKWKFRAIDFLEQVAAKRPDLRDTRIAIQFSRGLSLTTVSDLIRDPRPLNADPTLILPASFGGLDGKGMLSADAVSKRKEAQDESDNADGDEDTQLENTGDAPSSTLDIADHDGYEPYENAPTRTRVLIGRTEDGWSARAMPGSKPLPVGWRLEPLYDTSTQLVNQIRRQSGLNVRLVQAIGFDDEGDRVRALVCLSPAPRRQPPGEQSLADHVATVECEAQRLADALRLEEPFRSALLFAARWHDEGKKADRWQRYIGAPDAGGQPLGKSAEWRDPRLLAGYRHEFGSLLRITEDEARRYFTDPQRKLTPEQQVAARDLALHLIAAHHGHARPHFVNPLDDDFASKCEETHLDVIRRYARLQRKYGRWGLAYLESLLRAADGAASRAVGLDPETDDDDAIDADGANA